jgi:hydrogenase nickel incorporation protein HypA/HybF
MHELGIASAALDQAIEQARLAGGQQVARIGLRVGALSGVDPDALQFAFKAILPGTPAEGAAIEIDPVAAVAHCAACDRDFTAEIAHVCECPHCGQLTADFRQGRELELVRLEIL